MGQKSEPLGFEQVYVIGLDSDGNPRGARFLVLKDSIVTAVMDMNCRFLLIRTLPYPPSECNCPSGTYSARGYW